MIKPSIGPSEVRFFSGSSNPRNANYANKANVAKRQKTFV